MNYVWSIYLFLFFCHLHISGYFVQSLLKVFQIMEALLLGSGSQPPPAYPEPTADGPGRQHYAHGARVQEPRQRQG